MHYIGEASLSYGRFPATFDGSLPSEAYENVSAAPYAIVDPNANSSLAKEPMCSDELAHYRAHRQSYLGRARLVARKTDDRFELEWFVESHSGTAHEQTLNIVAGSPDVEALRALSRDDLLYECCERMVACAMAQSKKAS